MRTVDVTPFTIHPVQDLHGLVAPLGARPEPPRPVVELKSVLGHMRPPVWRTLVRDLVSPFLK